MSKGILVVDMPESCEKCPMLNGADECILQDEDANFAADTLEDLKEGCPLVELPEKKDAICYEHDSWPTIQKKTENGGWNACIDKIVGQ